MALSPLPACILTLLFAATISAWGQDPDSVANAIKPRITEAPVLVRQAGTNSCGTSAPYDSCIGPFYTKPVLCEVTSEFGTGSASMSCACSTNAIYLSCWSSYCAGDPLYSSSLSQLQSDNALFCSGITTAGAGGEGGSTAAASTMPSTDTDSTPATAASSTPTGITSTAGAATTSSKTSGGVPSPRLSYELMILSGVVAVWLAAAATVVL